MAEPSNPYDPNAVAVYVASQDIPISAHPSLKIALEPTGFDLNMVLADQYWHLGYIPKEFAAELKATRTVVNDESVPVSFTLNTSGRPAVRFSDPVL